MVSGGMDAPDQGPNYCLKDLCFVRRALSRNLNIVP